MCTVCLSKRNKHETEAYGIVFIGQQIQSIDFMFAQPNWRAAVSLCLPILCTYLCTGYMSNEHKHCIHGVLFCLWFYKIYIRNFKVRHFVAEYVPHLHYPFCNRIPIPYATIEMWAFFCTFVYWMNSFFFVSENRFHFTVVYFQWCLQNTPQFEFNSFVWVLNKFRNWKEKAENLVLWFFKQRMYGRRMTIRRWNNCVKIKIRERRAHIKYS